MVATAPRHDTFVCSSPPSYESIIQEGNIPNSNKLNKNPYLELGRKLSYGTVSDSDGVSIFSGLDIEITYTIFLTISFRMVIIDHQLMEKVFVLNQFIHLYRMVPILIYHFHLLKYMLNLTLIQQKIY